MIHLFKQNKFKWLDYFYIKFHFKTLLKIINVISVKKLFM